MRLRTLIDRLRKTDRIVFAKVFSLSMKSLDLYEFFDKAQSIEQFMLPMRQKRRHSLFHNEIRFDRLHKKAIKSYYDLSEEHYQYITQRCQDIDTFIKRIEDICTLKELGVS